MSDSVRIAGEQLKALLERSREEKGILLQILLTTTNKDINRDHLSAFCKGMDMSIFVIIRLSVIHRYLADKLYMHPLILQDYSEYENQPYLHPSNLIFTLTQGSIKYHVSIAVPYDRPNDLSNKVLFAEVMVYKTNIEDDSSRIYFTRDDFGLPFIKQERNREYVEIFTEPIPQDLQKEIDDRVFDTFSLQEVAQVIQKFDSWFGSGMD